MTVRGYDASVEAAEGQTVSAGLVKEYVAGEPVRLFPDQPARSLGLPIEDVPVVAWDGGDFGGWAKPQDADGDGQYSLAEVQAAFDSGAHTVYFPEARSRSFEPVEYQQKTAWGDLSASIVFTKSREDVQTYPGGDVRVPASVRRVYGFHRHAGVTLVVNEASNEPLVIEDIRVGSVKLRAPRPVVARNVPWMYVQKQIPPGVSGPPVKFFTSSAGLFSENDMKGSDYPMHIWSRFHNPEAMQSQIWLGSNDRMVVLTYKSEYLQPNQSFWALQPGAMLEIFGGEMLWSSPTDNVYFLNNNNAHASFAALNPTSGKLRYHVREVRDGVEKLW